MKAKTKDDESLFAEDQDKHLHLTKSKMILISMEDDPVSLSSARVVPREP